MADTRKKILSLALVVKEGNQDALKLGHAMEKWLQDQGLSVWVSYLGGRERCCEAMPLVDLALTLGGDGTFVSVARQLMGKGIPLAGVNFGRVGFLAELAPDSWRQSLEMPLAEGIRIERRMALRYTHFRGDEVLRTGEVINDVVVTRGRLARLVNLELAVNGVPLMVLRSDGLILSSPTGSSGYAGSAGGPLLWPSLNAYVVAAICPYLSSFPPLVLEANTLFSVTMGEAGADLYLTLDGQEVYSLIVGDRIEVCGVPELFLVAEMGISNYFERLRLSGFVLESRTTAPGK